MAGLRSHYHVKGSFRVSLCSLYPGLLGAALPRGPLPATRVPPGSEGSQVLGRQQDKLPSPGAQEPEVTMSLAWQGWQVESDKGCSALCSRGSALG